jgi:hypothetical protein
VISLETLLDLDKLLIEEAAGHLRVVEQRRKKRSMSLAADTGRRLMLTEEEWSMRMKAKEKVGTSGSSVSNGSGGRCRGGGRSGGASDLDSSDGGGGMAHVTTAADWAIGHANVMPRRRARPTWAKMMSHRCCW